MLNPRSTAIRLLLSGSRGVEIVTRVNLFLDKFICWSEGMRNSHGCTTPANKFSLSSAVASRVDSANEDCRRNPDSELFLRESCTMFGGSLGIEPVSLL